MGNRRADSLLTNLRAPVASKHSHVRRLKAFGRIASRVRQFESVAHPFIVKHRWRPKRLLQFSRAPPRCGGVHKASEVLDSSLRIG